jgi:hypothetical protein
VGFQAAANRVNRRRLSLGSDHDRLRSLPGLTGSVSGRRQSRQSPP